MPLAVRMLWLWLFVVIGFFTLARFRLDHYIFPAAPACCVIAARAWVNAVEDRRWRATRVAIGIVAVVLVAGAVIASAMMFRIDLGLDKKALALPLALVAGGGLLAVEMIRRRGAPPPRPTVLALTLLASYAVVVVVGLPVLEGSRPTAPLGRWIAENAPNESVVGSYGLTDWRASIRFYADRRVVELPSLDEVRAFFEQHPDGYVLMRSRHYRALREAGLDVHEVGGLPAIVGRTGKYFRRQVWGRILVVTVSGRTQPPLGPPHT
jgi:4-amino-4-deoxy-L-arabinose transferase-like glycosyltransferase